MNYNKYNKYSNSGNYGLSSGISDFLSPGLITKIGAALLVIAMFIPYVKLSLSGFGMSLSESYKIYDIDKWAVASVCILVFLTMFATFFDSKILMLLICLDLIYSNYKVIKAVSGVKSISYNGLVFKMSFQFGFYFYILGSILLVAGLIWKIKNDWRSF